MVTVVKQFNCDTERKLHVYEKDLIVNIGTISPHGTNQLYPCMYICIHEFKYFHLYEQTKIDNLRAITVNLP